MTINDWFRQAKKPSYWITEDSPVDAQFLGKLVYAGLILLLIYRWYSGRILMDLALSPVIEPEVDNTFWLVLASGIPEILIQSPILCIITDVMLLALACLGYIRSDRVKVTWIFLVLFFIQTITLEAYSSSHSKTVICIFITLLPFCFRNQKWVRLWEFARYYLAFMMVNSAISKLYYGGLFTRDQMTNILVSQHTDLQILAPDTLHTGFIQHLISSPQLSNSLYILAFLMQLIFITAFFTKKIDKILSVLLISFVIGTYFLMRIYNLDLLMMVLPLWFSIVYFNPVYTHQREKTTIIIKRFT